MKLIYMSALLALVAFNVAGMASNLPVPERIYSGTKSQTKTYMHQFVESPDGTKYAFRYFLTRISRRTEKTVLAHARCGSATAT